MPFIKEIKKLFSCGGPYDAGTDNRARPHMTIAGIITHFGKHKPLKSLVPKSWEGDYETTSTYSTLDVARILGIEKSRVRDWIVKGFIIPSWHIAMARGDKNLLTYDDLCSVYLFQQLRSKGFHRTPIAFIIREIAKTGLTKNLKYGLRYMIWNTRHPKEGGKVEVFHKMPNLMTDTSSQMLVVDLFKIKNEVDRKRIKRGGKRLRTAS
jgi:hypothetical protein